MYACLVSFIVILTSAIDPASISGSAAAQQPDRGDLNADQQKQLEEADELDRTAVRLREERHYAEATAAAEKNVALREQVYGKTHPEITNSLYLLARLYKIQRKNQEARGLYERIVTITEMAMGPDDPATATALNNLGFFLDGIGDYDAARPVYERALRIRDTALGPEDSATVQSVVNLAYLLNLQKEYAEVIPLYRRALKTRTETLGADHSETMFCLTGLAIAYAGNGSSEEAESLFRQAVEICEQSVGKDHIRTANALERLADHHRTHSNPEAAEPLYRRILKIHEAALEPDAPATAMVLNKLAFMYDNQQRFGEAEPLYQRALSIREKVLGPEHSLTVESMVNLAFLYNEQGRYQEALPLNQRILEIRERILGADHPETISSITNLAFTYDHIGNYLQAEPLYEQALELSDQVLGIDHPETATAVGNLALFYNSMGRYSDAEPLYLRAVAINEKARGTDHAATATSLDNLAGFFFEQANYPAALPLHQKALKIYEQQLGPEHSDTARCLVNVANVYKALGNYDAALPLFQRALNINEKVLGPDHPDTANSLNHLAALLRRQGHDEDAEPLYERSIRIRERVLGKDHLQTANAINNLAILYISQDKLDVAESLLLRALSIHETQLGAAHPSVARTRINLAVLNGKQQEFDQAEIHSRRAVEQLEKSPGNSHPLTITATTTMGAIHAQLGHFKEASDAIDKARRGTRKHVSHILPSLSETEQIMFLTDTYQNGLYIALSLALANHSDTELVQRSATWLINGKAVAQEAMAQRNLLSRGQNDPQSEETATQLLQIRTQLAGLAMSAASGDRAESRKQLVEQLTERERNLSQQLSDTGGSRLAAEPEWVDLQQVKQSLPEDGVLIDIARFDLFSFAKDPESPWQPAHYAAWITHRGNTEHSTLIDLGDAAQIDSLVETIRRRMQNAGAAIRTDGEEAATSAVSKDLQTLAEKIWRPLVPHLGSARQILLSPDGALWLAPWIALPTDDAGERFLVEDYSVRLVVSGRDLTTQPQLFEKQQPVILANPKFNQQQAEKRESIQQIFNEDPPAGPDTTRSFSAQSLVGSVSSLPGTAIEAIAIQPNLEEYAGQKAVLYQEQYALERVAKAMRHPKVVSFATHGFFLPTPETSPNESDPFDLEGTRSVPVDLNSQPIENPLLRCGLLLAGCNNRDATVGDDDGILTGLEIVGIDFRGTELVVLSACETGIGDVRNGEGVAGLRQAFQLAGAEAVVSTLWQVPDRDSAVLMSKFFEELAAGESKSEALRNAQLERLEKRRERYGAAHPFFWAAFTLTGR